MTRWLEHYKEVNAAKDSAMNDPSNQNDVHQQQEQDANPINNVNGEIKANPTDQVVNGELESIDWTEQDQRLFEILRQRLQSIPPKPSAATKDAECNTDVTISADLERDIQAIHDIYLPRQITELNALIALSVCRKD